jgi:hypothetical protein
MLHCLHRTQAHDFSPILLGSLSTTPLPLFCCPFLHQDELSFKGPCCLSCSCPLLGLLAQLCVRPSGYWWFISVFRFPHVSYVIHIFADWLLCLPPAFTLVSSLSYSSILKVEATCASKTSADIQWTTWCYVPLTTAVRTSNPTFILAICFMSVYNKYNNFIYLILHGWSYKLVL